MTQQVLLKSPVRKFRVQIVPSTLVVYLKDKKKENFSVCRSEINIPVKILNHSTLFTLFVKPRYPNIKSKKSAMNVGILYKDLSRLGMD